MNYYASMHSPLGTLLMQSDGVGLAGLYFVGQKDCPNIDGFAPMRPQHFDPKAGEYQGQSIRLLKAVRQQEQSDLFTAEDPVFSGSVSTDAKNSHSGRVSGVAGPEPADRAWASMQPGSEADCASLNAMQADTPAMALALFERTQVQLREYFKGQRQAFDLPLQPQGTAFQKKVWQALLQIPYGQLVSYGDIARATGLSSGHGRAVGTAVGRNPLTIIIPCHRVVSSSGTLTGYSGGLERKLALLQLEGFSLS